MRGMERYRVSRHADVAMIVDALEKSGAKIIRPPDPTQAPFEITIETPRGEALELVCYAFHANKYEQGKRPGDEHRFQVKYGSDFSRYHQIYIADERNRVTLMFGVHVEAGIFVAVDPAMHETTWFSKSIEFKDEHVEGARERGWIGWERERSVARRKAMKPFASYEDEVLLAFTPEHFLRYVELERMATGLPPGRRLLWIDTFAPGEQTRLARPHSLETELQLPASKIMDIINDAFRLKVAVRGSVAEKHLLDQVTGMPGVTSARTLDEDGRPDLEVVYKKRRPVYIECKNVGRTPVAAGPKVDFQKTRAAKSDPCSRYYQASQFEILAACLQPITEAWEFKYCLTAQLPPHRTCPGRLSQRVVVSGVTWEQPLVDLLDIASSGRFVGPSQ